MWYHQGGGKQYYEQWRQEHPELLASTSRRHHLKKKGLTEATFNALLRQQGGRCAICRRLASGAKKRFAVDHDHRTNKYRGLLCSSCNTGLGLFLDKIGLLQKAIRYLEGK